MTDIDVAAAESAIATAVAYPRLIHEAATQAQGVALGPWTVSISCNYGTSDANHYSSQVSVDFTVTRTQLQQAIATAESQASTFLDHFNFVSVWMAQTLPLTSSVFATAAAAVDAAVSAGRHGTPTQAMVDTAVKDLSDLVSTLQANSKQLSDGVAGLAQFNIQLTSCAQLVQQAAANLKSTAQSALDQVADQARSAPCGGDGAMSQIVGFQIQLLSSGAVLDGTFAQLASHTKDAQSAVSVLLGTVVNLISEYQGVLNQVKTVQGQAAATIMQQIRLMVAASAWKSLTQYATAQLGCERAALQSQLARLPLRATALQIENALSRVYGGVH
jgi:hypothetical protein